MSKSADMPQVIYFWEEESELLNALAEGRIAPVARGEIGSRDAVRFLVAGSPSHYPR